MMNAARRILKEQEKMKADAVPGIKAGPKGEDLYHWSAVVAGPEGSPYEGGAFELDVRLPTRYPMEPPIVKFRTPIFHPNVGSGGDICLDILQEQWSPVLSLQKVLLSISSLLTDPNFSDPLDQAAATLYRKSRPEYDARCRDMTRRHAMSGVSVRGGGTKRKASEPIPPSGGAPAADAAQDASETRPPASQGSGHPSRGSRASPQPKAGAKAMAAQPRGAAKAKAKAKAKPKAKPKAKAKARG
jgi:ubiquitin-conjugating enzyme E2 D/E